MGHPRILHHIWFGGDPPEHLAGYMQTWRDHHPGWEYHLWTEDNLPPLRHQRLFDEARQITAPNHHWQLMADIARYEILHDIGGLYVDADFECRRSLDPLADLIDCYTAWEEQHLFLNFAVAATRPGHPYLAAILDGLEASITGNPLARPNRQSGPHYLTRVYRRRFDESVVVFPQDLFYPYSYRDVGREPDDYGDAWAVHHWNNWRTNMKGRR